MNNSTRLDLEDACRELGQLAACGFVAGVVVVGIMSIIGPTIEPMDILGWMAIYTGMLPAAAITMCTVGYTLTTVCEVAWAAMKKIAAWEGPSFSHSGIIGD